MRSAISAAILILASASAPAMAPADYIQRVADAYRAAMQAQDYNGDGIVTREEARIDLLLSGRFDIIDIDGDGGITAEEFERFLAELPNHPELL